MRISRFFYYLTLLLLPTQLGYHMWPTWAFVLGRRIDYLSPTIFLTDITIICTWLFWILNYRNIQTKNFLSFILSIIRQHVLIILALVVFITLNILLSFSPVVTIYKWTKFLEFVFFGLYIIFTKPSFINSLICLTVAGIYSSCIAIIQLSLQHSVGGVLKFIGERSFSQSTPGIARTQLFIPLYSSYTRLSGEFLRAYATFPHPNVLGGFLSILLSLQCSLLIFRKKTFGIALNVNNFRRIAINILVISMLCIELFGLISSFSRSAFFAFALILFITKLQTIFQYDRKYVGNIFGYIPVFLLMVSFAFLCVGLIPMLQLNESIVVRHQLNISAINLFLQSPLFGIGLGNYLTLLPTIYPHSTIFFLQPVHNIYLLLLSETGIIGYMVLYFGFKKIPSPYGSYLHEFQSIAIYSLIGYLCIGLVDHYPLTLQQGQILLTVLIAYSFPSSRS